MARITSAASPIEGADLRQENTIQKGPAAALQFDDNGKYVPVVLTAVGKVQYKADLASATWSDTIPDGVLIAGKPVKFRIRANGVTPVDNGTFRYDFLMATEGAGGLNLYNTGPNEAMVVGTTPADQVGKTFSVNVTVKDSIGTSKTGTALTKAWVATPVAVTGVTIAPKTASLSLAGTKTQQLTPTIAPAGAIVGVNCCVLAGTKTQQLTPTIAPAGATNKAVTYVSSDPTKATVNASGLVTGVAIGTTTITVTTADGSKTDTCAVTVAA